MNKFRKFCEKPLLTIAIILVAISILTNLVILIIPYGSHYEYNYKDNDASCTYEVFLQDKFTSDHTYILDDLLYDFDSSKPKKYDYEVDGGKLYLLDGVTSERQLIGDINSRKLILNYDVVGQDTNTVLTCKLNNTIMIIAVIFFFISIALMLFSILMRSLNLNYAKKIEEHPEILEKKANNGDVEYDDDEGDLEELQVPVAFIDMSEESAYINVHEEVQENKEN